MPESPEVDALAGFLRTEAVGRRIDGTELDEFRALKTRARPLTQLEGTTVTGVRRFGKHISIDTGGPDLVISFGRAGWATWTEKDAAPPAAAEGETPAPAPEIARISFDDGSRLAVTDAGDWLSLGLSVVDDPADVPAVSRLGPDPLSDAFTPEVLDRIVVARRKQLKALLQEQESLAGIGNAYSDEILHAARLSPVVHASALDEGERARLYTAIRDELGTALAARRSIPISVQKAAKVAAMRVHGRTGEPCPVCGGTVLDVPGSKGAAQYCPTCQTGGEPLPD